MTVFGLVLLGTDYLNNQTIKAEIKEIQEVSTGLNGFKKTLNMMIGNVKEQEKRSTEKGEDTMEECYNRL